MATPISQPFPVFTDIDGTPLNNGFVYIGTQNLNPETNSIACYWDEALTLPATQPLRTIGGFIVRSGSPATVYISATNYSITIRNKNNALVFSGLNAQDFISRIMSSSGSSLVGFIQSGTGAVVRTAQDKLRDSVNAKDFGVIGNGITETSASLKAFFDYCISTGTSGHIPAGTYLINEGVLKFDALFTDKQWPEITTDGAAAVIFKAAGFADAPLLEISNGTATSGAFKGWRDGSLGGITFTDTTGAVSPNRHGLLLRGVWGLNVDYVIGNTLRANLIHVEQKKFGGTNPDPYNVAFCTFGIIEANSCVGAALYNGNDLGFTGNRIEFLRVVGCSAGWFGFGTMNSLGSISAANVSGWVFEDNTSTVSGITLSKISIGSGELDNCQYGVRLNHAYQISLGKLRFINRYQTAPNTTANYWPRIAIDMAAGTLPSIQDVTGSLFHRLEAGGLLADLGLFINGNNSGNAIDYDFDNFVADNGGLGFTSSLLTSNIAANEFGVVRYRGVPIVDRRVKIASIVNSATTESVPNTGFGTTAAKLVFATAIYDRGSYYDTANSWFTVPFTGIYRVTGRICLTVAIGTRVRIAFATVSAGIKANKTCYQVNAGAQHYELDGVLSLTAGDQVYLMADQNTAGSVTMSAPISGAADLNWSIEAL